MPDAASVAALLGALRQPPNAGERRRSVASTRRMQDDDCVPSEPIRSVQNPLVKELVRLRRRRARVPGAPILIDGRREIDRAAGGGIRLRQIVTDAESPDKAIPIWARRTAASTGADLIEVTGAVFGKIAYGDRGEGVLATADRPAGGLVSLELSKHPLIAVLDTVEKPGNLGACVRSADAAGVDAVLVTDPRLDVFGPNAIRAALGTIFCLPVIETTTGEAVRWLERRGIRVVAATPEAESLYFDVDLTGPTALVLGGEANGLSDAWRAAAAATARLPMRGIGDSLNLSVAAARMFYEALRQRGVQQPR